MSHPRQSFRSAFLVAAAIALAPAEGRAADIQKDNNQNALNLGTSFVGGSVPSGTDMVVFDSLYNNGTGTTVTLGANASFSGFRFGAMSGTAGSKLIIGDSVAYTLSIGSGGIDASASTMNLQFGGTGVQTLNITANQTWSLAGGRTLTTGGADALLGRMTGSGDITLSQSGTGTATFEIGSDGTGGTGYSGSWYIGSNVLAKASQSNAIAWGTGRIYLNGGTLATGIGRGGNIGNWTWNNDTILQSGGATIDNSNTGSNRFLNLNNHFAGSGALTFANTPALGIVYTLGSGNSFSGGITINSGVTVQVGGSGPTSSTATGGVLGSLGTGAVTVNSTATRALNFARTGITYVGNSIGGTGRVEFFSNLTAATTLGITYLTGTNTYAGLTAIYGNANTFVSVGSLNTTTGNLGAGTIALIGGNLIYTGAGETITRSIQQSATAGIYANGSGALVWNPAGFNNNGADTARTITLGGTSTQANTFGSDWGGLTTTKANIAITKANVGTWVLNTAQTYTGVTTLSGGTLRFDFSAGASAPANILPSTNTLTFTGSSTLDVKGRASTTSTQLLGAITLTSGNATLLTTANSATALSLDFTTFTRSAGATVAFSGNTGTAYIGTTQANANGIIGPWAFVGTGNAWDYAVSPTTNTAGSSNVTALASSTAVPTTGGANTNNYASALSGTAITLGGNVTANTIRLTSHTAAASVALGANSLTTAGLLLTGSNSGATTISGTTGSTAAGALGNGTGEFIINNSSASTLTITAPLINASATSTAGSLTKTGAGTVIINGFTAVSGANVNSNAFSGAVSVNQGELQSLATSPGTTTGLTTGTYTPFGTGAITVNPGATLRFKTGSNSIAYTYANNINLRDATLISDDGVNTFSGTINSTGWSTIQTQWSGKTATLSGQITGTGFLDFVGTGAISLTNTNNTFTGYYTLRSGTLVLGGAATSLGAASGLTINSGATATWDRSTTTSNLFSNTTTSVVDLKGTLNITQSYSAGGTTTTLNIPKLLLNGGTLTGASSLGSIALRLSGAAEAVAGTTSVINVTGGGYQRSILFDGEFSGAGNLTLNRGTSTGAGPPASYIGFRNNTVGYSGNITVSSATANGFVFFGGAGGWGSGLLTLSGSGSNVVLGNAEGQVSLAGAAGTGILTGTQNIQGSATLGASTNLYLLNQSASAFISAEIAGAVTLNGGTMALNGSYASPGAFIPYTNATWTVGGSAVSTISAPLSINYSGVSFSVADSVAGAGADLLVSGVVRGDKQLTKSGVGTMALTAANTTSGGFNVTAGTLNVGNAGATGDLGTGTTAIGASGTVALNHSADFTLSNAFTGTGVISKVQGSAVETLSGNLSGFTGTIAIAAGTVGTANVLTIGNSATLAASSTITVAQYAALRSTGTAAVGNVTLSNGGNLQIVAGTPTEASAFFTATGTVAFVTGSGFYITNTSAIAEGTYRLLNYGSGALTYNGSTNIAGLTVSALASSRNVFTLSNDTTNKYLNMTVTGVAASIVWNGSLATWDAAQAGGAGKAFNNSALDIADPAYPADYFYNFDAVTFDDTGAANTTIAVTGALTPGNITVAGSQNYTFGGTGSLSGVANIVKNGSGTLRLENSGANNLSGTITVNGGKLAVTAAYTMSTGGLILNDGTTFANSTAATPKTIGRNLTASGAVAFGDATDTGALTFSATNNLSALTTVTANVATTFSGATTIGTALTVEGAGGVTASSALALAGNTTLTVNGAGGATLSGAVSGAFSLSKLGTGTLTLSGANTYSGTTTVSAGTLRASHASALGGTAAANGGALIIRGGTLELAFTSSTGAYGSSTTNWAIRTGNITMGGLSGATSTLSSSGSISGNPVGFSLGPGFSNTLTYDATNNGGTATISAFWAAVGTTNTGSTTVTVGDSTATNVELDFTGRISNTGQNDGRGMTMVKAGAGAMRISAANFLPGVQVDAGTLIVNHASALGASRTGDTGIANLVTVKGGTLDLNGFSNAIGGLSDGGATAGTILNNATAAASTLTVGSSNANTTFAGLIADGTSSVALAKQGTGTLTLSGANSYSGGTTVSAGTLVVGANTSLGGGSVTVGGGASGPILQLSNGVIVTNAFTLGTSAGTASRGMLEVKGSSLGGTSGLVTISAAPTAGTHFAVDSGATFQLLGGISSASTAVSFGAGNYILGGTSSYASATLASGSIKLGSADGLASGSTFTMGTGASASTLDLNGYSQAGGLTLATGAGGLTVTNTSATAASINLANSGAAGTIGFNITGNTALVLSGAGSKNLTGVNTHTGGTTVSNGTLDLTSTAGLGTGSLAISSGAGFSFTSASAATLSSAVSGSGSFDKAGAGSLTLSGNLSGFTGSINVNGGGLVITSGSLGGSAGTSLLSVGNAGSAASLSGSFTTSRDVKVWDGSTLRASTGLTPGSLTLTNGASLNLGEGLFGSGTAQLNVLIGESASDVINVTGGALVLSGNVSVTFVNGGFGNGRYNFLTYDVNNAGNSLGGTVSLSSATYGHTAISSVVHDTVNGAFYVDVTKASMVWLGGTGDVDGTTANFKLSTTGLADLILAGDELIFDDTASTRTVNLTGTNPDLGKITVDTTAGYAFSGTGGLAGASAQLIKQGSGVLTLGGNNTFGGGIIVTGGTLAVDRDGELGDAAGGITLGAGTTLQATDTFTLGATRSISLSGNASVAVDATKTLTYGGSIIGSSGLTKAGNGTLVLTGSNAHSGGTTVDAGTLQLGVNNALSAVGAVTVNAGALDLGATNQTVGAVTVAGGAVTGSGTLTFSSLTATNNGDATLSAVLAGSGSTFVKSGTGALTLGVANTFSGGTTLNAGTIRVANAAALGTGTVTLNGGELSSASTTGYTLGNAIVIGGDVTLGDTTNTGALTFGGAVGLGGGNRTLTIDSAVTISGVITNGGLTKAGLGTLTLTGANTYSGDTVINAGTLSQSSNTAFGGSITVGSAGTLAFTRSTGGGALANNISGTGAITFTGGASGELGLTGSNDFSGSISIVSGKLAFAGANSANGAPTVTIASGATLSLGDGLNGGVAYVTNLSGAGNVNGTWGGTAGTRRLSVNTTVDSTLTGTITDGTSSRLVALTKTGNATLNLNATNSFTGGTTVTAGTLATNNNTGFGAAGNLVTLSPGASNAALLISYSVTSSHAITVSGSGAGTATIGSLYSASNGLNTQYSNTITLGRDVTLLGNTGDRTTFAGKITGTGNVTISSAYATLANSRVSFAQAAVGVANDFVGDLIIAAGSQLQLGVGTNTNNFAIPDAANIRFANANSYFRFSASGSTGGVETVNALISDAAGAGFIQATEGNATLTIGSANGSGTFSGVIGYDGTRTLNITKVGTGNQTLSGNNTFIGTTTLTAGTLTLGHSSALGMSTLALNGGTLALDPTITSFTFGGLTAASAGAGYDISLSTAEETPRAIALTVGANNSTGTYAGVLSGLGSLTKSGTGTLTLNGANSYSGATTITGGTLALASGATLGSGAITFSAAAAAGLQLTIGDSSAVALSQDIVLTNPGSALNYTLYKTSNATPALGTLTLAGNISGGGANTTLFLNASAADGLTSFRLSGNNTFQGTLRLNRGNLIVGAASELGNAANTLYLDSYQNLTDGSLRFVNDVSLTQSVVLSYATVGINTGAYNVGLSGAVSGTYGFQKIGSGTLTLSGAATYGTTSNVTTIAEGTVALVGGANRLAAGTALTIGSAAAAGSLVMGDASGAVTQSVGSLASSGLGGSILGGSSSNSTLTVTGGTTTFAGTIGGAGANQNNLALAYSGSGALTLSGTNTYAGGTTISSGTIRVGSNSALGSGAIAISGGAISSDSASARTLANSLAIGGNVTLGDGTNTGALTVNGTVDLGNATRTLSVASSVTLANTVSNGTLVKDGVGSLTLSAANSLTAVTLGNTTANTSSTSTATASSGGFVVLGNAGALGSGTVTLRGAQIQAGVSGLTVTNALSIDTGALRFSGSNDLTLSGAVSLVAGATRGIGNYSTTANLTLQSDINLGANGLIFQGSSAASAVTAKIILNGALSGAGGISTDSTYANRTVDLNGATTYTGATSIAGGTVNIASGSTLASNASISAGTLRLSNATRLTGTVTLSSSGRLEMAGGTAGAITVGGGQSLVVSGGTNTLTSVTMSSSGSFSATGGTLNVGALSTASSQGTSWSIGAGATVNATNFSNSWNPASFTVNGTLNLSSTTANSASAAWNQSTNGAMTIAGTGTINITGGFNSANAAGTITTFAINRVNIGGGTAQIGFSKTAASSTIILGGATNATTIGVFGQNWSSSVGISLGTAGVTFDTQDSADGTTGRTISLSGALVDHTSNVGKLTKAGAGTLTLSATNTYTGGTTVNGGVLNLSGGGGATGTIRGTVTVNTGGTLRLSAGDVTGYNTDATRLSTINLVGGALDVNTTSNQTLGSATVNMTGASITGIAGSNIDFFAGSSTLNSLASSTTSTISGVQLSLNRQGATTLTVAAGTTASGIDLQIDSVIKNSASGDAAGTLTKAGNGWLRLTGTNTSDHAIAITAGTLEIGGSGSLGSGNFGATISNAGTLVFSTSASQTLSAALSGAGALTKSGSGTLTLAAANPSFSGATSVSGGTLTASVNGALTTGSVSVSAGTLDIGSTTQSVGALTYTGGTISGTGRINASAYSFGDNATLASGLTLGGSAALTKSTNGTLTINSTLANSGGVSVSAGTLVLTATNSYTGGTSVTGGTLVGNASSLQGAITNNAAVTFNQGSAGTYSGVISGTGSLTKAGNGALTLSGANTYAGATNVNAGTLVLARADAISVDSALTIGSGGTLSLNYALGSADAITRVFSGSGILDLALSGYTSTLTGLTGFNGTLRLSTGTVFDSVASGWTRDIVFAGGVLVPSALSNYSGTVTVASGTTLNATDGLPANVVVASGATIDFTGATGNALSSTIQYAGGALANAANFTGNLVVAGTGVSISSAALGGSSATVVVGAGSSVELTGTITNTVNVTGGSVNLAGAASGNLVVDGGTVTGGSNFTGNLVVASGNVGIGTTIDALGSTAKVTLSGGTLNLAGGSLASTNTIEYTGGTLAGGSNFTGTVAVQTGATLANSSTLGGTVAVQTGASVANTGTLTGTVSVTGGTVTNSGTVSGTVNLSGGSLTNAGTVSGSVTVASGSLVNNGTVTGTTLVQSGATLSGNGTFAGTTISSGAILSPGSSPGIQTYTSTLIIQGGSTWTQQFYSDVAEYTTGELAGKRGYDTIAITSGGALDLSAATHLNKITLQVMTLTQWADSAAGVPQWGNLTFERATSGPYPWVPKDFVIASYTGNAILAANENITSIFTINTGGFYYETGPNAASYWASTPHPWGEPFSLYERLNAQTGLTELTLRVVPEPSTYGMILGGLALAAAAIRRRRARKA